MGDQKFVVRIHYSGYVEYFEEAENEQKAEDQALANHSRRLIMSDRMETVKESEVFEDNKEFYDA